MKLNYSSILVAANLVVAAAVAVYRLEWETCLGLVLVVVIPLVLHQFQPLYEIK